MHSLRHNTVTISYTTSNFSSSVTYKNVSVYVAVCKFMTCGLFDNARIDSVIANYSVFDMKEV